MNPQNLCNAQNQSIFTKLTWKQIDNIIKAKFFTILQESNPKWIFHSEIFGTKIRFAKIICFTYLSILLSQELDLAQSYPMFAGAGSYK
jgi:hypothetical protein